MAYDLTHTRKFRKVGGFLGGEPSYVEFSGDGKVYRSVHPNGTSSEWGETDNNSMNVTVAEDRVRRGEWEEVTAEESQ
jgi:hypothetical protein